MEEASIANIAGNEAAVVQEVAAAPEPIQEVAASDDKPTQAAVEPELPKPELSLKEKIQAKAAEVAKSRDEQAKKAPKTAETAQKEAAATPPQTGEKPVIEAGKEGEKAAYTPNYKMKVMDTDCEVPEVLRPLMKDKESEEAIRKISAKALGLDFVKPKLEEARQQVQKVTGEHSTVLGQIGQAKQLYARGDIDGWLKMLNVPEERILQWVADKIHYNQLPAEQKQILDARRQAEERAFAAEQQVSSFQTSNEQLLHQQVQGRLDSVLTRPEIKSVADAFDARVNKPGAFKEEINRRGDYAWRTRNEIVPPEQLVQEMLQFFVGPAAPAATVTPASTEAPAPQAAAPASSTAKKAPPTIPNISGRGTSAVSAPMRSLDDLRKRAKELNATA